MKFDRSTASPLRHGWRLLVCLFAIVLLVALGAVIGGAGSGGTKDTHLSAQDVVATTSESSGPATGP